MAVPRWDALKPRTLSHGCLILKRGARTDMSIEARSPPALTER